MSKLFGYFIFFLINVISTVGMAQNVFPYVQVDTVPVSVNGSVLNQPWAGGINNAQIGQMDVNFDCLPDLVIFDRVGGEIKVYVNVGDSISPAYKYDPIFSSHFPTDLYDVAIFKDYNNDGKIDIFTHEGPGVSGLKVYKNVSDSTLKFELHNNRVMATNQGFPWQVYMGIGNYAAIHDVDGDGYVDFLGYPVGSSLIEYYKNAGQDPDTVHLELQTSCWGRFYESNDSIKFNAVCKGRSENNDPSRHAGGVITAFDYNSDGLTDILFSDPEEANVKLIINGGTVNDANMTSVEYNFPQSASQPINLEGTPLVGFGNVYDLENQSMIVSPHDVFKSRDTGNVWLYDITNDNGVANFEFIQNDFLVGEQIDVGSQAIPKFFDVNGDGLLDLLISNYGYFDSLAYPPGMVVKQAYHTSRIAYLENTGQPGAPEFTMITDDYLNLSTKGYTKQVPVFGDLNGNGLDDMLIMNSKGYLSYYENMGGVGTPANFMLVADTFNNIQYTDAYAIELFDINADGLLDLLVIKNAGEVNVYFNTGTANAPSFPNQSITGLGGISQPYNFSSQVLDMSMTIDSFPDYGPLLVVANGHGELHFYEGLNNGGTGAYNLVDSIKLARSALFPAFGNLGTADSMTLVVGTLSGGVHMLEVDPMAYGFNPYPMGGCETTTPGDTTTDPGDTTGVNNLIPIHGFDLYPNPTSGQFQVALSNIANQKVTIRVVDLGGKTLFVQDYAISGNEVITVQPSQLPSGMVLVEVVTQEGQFYKRLVVR